MDNRPIGFFDSGLGGLTCIPPLLSAMPEERVIYFGDTARTPYGSKAPSTIINFSLQIADFLVERNVKMIVIACNTISAVALDEIKKAHPDLPVLGIIAPAVDRIAQEQGQLATGSAREGKKVGVIGTKATIKSQAYEKFIKAKVPDLALHSKACPALVPLIEEGIIENEIMDLTLKYYLDTFISYYKINQLVLGCTHYPLVGPNIERLYPGIDILDPAEEMAARIKDVLTANKMLAKNSDLDNSFYASDLSENFVNMINRIFEDQGFNVSFQSFT